MCAWSKSVNLWKGYNWKNVTSTQIVKEQCWISRLSQSQGHNTTCWRKGLDLSNNLCKYEVNQQTNEKGIREKQNYTQIVNDDQSLKSPSWKQTKKIKKQTHVNLCSNEC